MPGLGGTGRTPRSPPRVRRNWGRLRTESNIVDGDAIQFNDDGQLTLVIGTDEPLSQSPAGLVLLIVAGEPISSSASGLALDLGADQTLLNKTGSTLQIDEDELYRQIQMFDVGE